MSRAIEELLEFDRLKAIVGGHTTCAPGRRAVEALGAPAPQRDVAALRAEFALIDEAVEYLRQGAELGFGSLADPAGWLARVAIPASVLTSGELLDAVSLMDTAFGVRQTFKDDKAKHPLLSEQAARLADFRSLTGAIRRAVLPNGEISDDASPRLRQIRTGLVQGREKIQRSLEAIMRARGATAGEDYVTLRNERFVIPVRASERRAVPGVVHGASGTGQTVFVEPLETIDLNNRLVQLAEDEMAEIARILEELTERVRAELGPLEFAAESIAHFDAVFARARFARAFDCTTPAFSDAIALDLHRARNPVLEATLRPQGRSAVPLTLALGAAEKGASLTSAVDRSASLTSAVDKDAPHTVLVISGPNTGGKTVALKTVGLAALSAQSAIPVAAERATLPIFDRVLADIGDEQSIAADLSTFSAHMLNIKSMLEVATERTLILVDEMGTGTAPEEGAALAVALLEEFRQRRALTLATTHHDRLKAYASTTPGILNAAMEFDTANLRPTYRLMVGVPGTSSGIEIARRLGLPARVVEHAEASLSPESREARDLIAYLHESRDDVEALQQEMRDERERLENERRALQSEWAARQKQRIAELERSFRETQKQLQEQVARLAEEIKDCALRAQTEKLAGRKFGKLAADARAEADAAVVQALAESQQDLGVSRGEERREVAASELAAGQRLQVKGFKQPVIFRRLDGRMAEVEAGPMRMKVPVADVIEILGDVATTAPEKGAAKKGGVGAVPPYGSPYGRAASARGVTVHSETGGTAAEEINVIGCTVEEATERVDKFIDNAALASKPSVRVIHGHGTGALRRGLAEFLSSHPLVERIHAEAEDRGGMAITVVELKE